VSRDGHPLPAASAKPGRQAGSNYHCCGCTFILGGAGGEG